MRERQPVGHDGELRNPINHVEDLMETIVREPFDTASRVRAMNVSRLVNFFAARRDYVSTRFMLSVGDTDYLLSVQNGLVADVKSGPFVTPSYEFRISASVVTWAELWSTAPAAGKHDLISLLKLRLLRLDGELHTFMSNLFFFKELLTSPRYFEEVHHG